MLGHHKPPHSRVGIGSKVASWVAAGMAFPVAVHKEVVVLAMVVLVTFALATVAVPGRVSLVAALAAVLAVVGCRAAAAGGWVGIGTGQCAVVTAGRPGAVAG